MDKQIKKTFKLKMAGQAIIDMEIEGSEELVNSFIKQTLIETFGAFYESRKVFQEYIMNGIKLKAQYVWRDEKGHFLSAKQMKEKIG